jgi:hypothetical protein
MRHILLAHRVALCLELLNRHGHEYRVPDHHGIREEIEAAGLMQLFFFVLFPYLPFIRKEQKVSQGVQRFAFDQLPIDPAPILLRRGQ